MQWKDINVRSEISEFFIFEIVQLKISFAQFSFNQKSLWEQRCIYSVMKIRNNPVQMQEHYSYRENTTKAHLVCFLITLYPLFLLFKKSPIQC